MLEAVTPKSRRIDKVERQGGVLVLRSEMGLHRLTPVSARVVRVTYTQREAFSDREKPGVMATGQYEDWDYTCDEDFVYYRTGELSVRIDRRTASYVYCDGAGRVLLKERGGDSKVLEEFQTYKLSDEKSGKIAKVQTADGVKEVVKDAERIPDEKLYHTRLHLEWKKEEALYGLGQQEEGILNLRGQTVYVHQANRKIAVPMLVSTEGYGILVDTYSPMIFNDTAAGSYLYTEADDEMDYYFMAGANLDGVVKEYRKLTGKASMLPKWAFGYLQSQERYETADEIRGVAEEYRKRNIGLDAIILDWLSWEDGMWGQKSFDPGRFPEPAKMIDKLHEQKIHFMISIWPNMSEECENYREMREKNALLPACSIYNALDENAGKIYWEQVKRGLYQYGIDAWWCDSSEPFTPEWERAERMEPGVLYAEYCRKVCDHLPAWAMNAYPFFHARGLYENQRREDKKKGGNQEKRVCILTRSAYTGQQRYGTILWSGDTSASWRTLREQIAAGLNFSASGFPYWTVDIGAFFVKKGNFWYWDGGYDGTTSDAGYLELFTRWYQWACFLPVFRGHGTDCRRELWEYQGEGNIFYDAIINANRLRYRLMPYIYSQAGKVWLEDASMIKLLAFDYPGDAVARDIRDQYLFGDSIMVCPVTEPMYYTAGSTPVVYDKTDKTAGKAYTRNVYLPDGNGWYEYESGKYWEGGQWIVVEAPISRIPLFVKEGSILPVTEPTEHVVARECIEWIVYGGKDCRYLLYQDDGDGYGYENGEYECVEYIWSEAEQILSDEKGEVYDCKRYIFSE